MDDTLRHMIHEGAGELKMEEYVRTTQPSLRDRGIQHVITGETTLDEVLAVTIN